jgi:hypothetical protein
MTSKIDATASTVEIDCVTGDVRIDGMLALRAFRRDGVLWLQFCDRDKMRSRARRPPTRFIEVCLRSFWEKLNSEFGGEDGSTN